MVDGKNPLRYQSYDAMPYLQKGENRIDLWLADGWYRSKSESPTVFRQSDTETRIAAILEMLFTDGTRQRIVTDKSWDWSPEGPIRFADRKDGELVEAWREPFESIYDGRIGIISRMLGIHRKAKAAKCPLIPIEPDGFCVRETSFYKPRLLVTPSGKTILDFGREISGYLQFTLEAHKGDRILLRFGDYIDRQGEFSRENYNGWGPKAVPARQEVEYYCKEGLNIYKTTFALFHFRYAEVEMTFSEEKCFTYRDVTASLMNLNPSAFTAIGLALEKEEEHKDIRSNKGRKNTGESLAKLRIV